MSEEHTEIHSQDEQRQQEQECPSQTAMASTATTTNDNHDDMMDHELPESSSLLPPQSEIQRLLPETIQRISAEQAISDLASIVKELVDNALDAESTTIKIRLFGQGLEIIEVSDDGCGVPPSSRPYMATKHATSKITSIDDIYSGTGLTMGFRGEALFSMANVSQQLIVATRTDAEELATKLVFGNDGTLVVPNKNGDTPSKDQQQQQQFEQFPRKVGTTVAVVQPFCRLPARRADMMRRIRGERTKIFKMLEAYGIFNVGVCFQLLDIVNTSNSGGSREDTALATSASSETLQETVSTVLGHPFLKSMTSVDISLDPILTRLYGENLYNWGIRGLISKEPSLQQETNAQQQQSASSGRGGSKQAHNRSVHYYSINGRVVDLPKVTDLIRKLWKAFGGKKKPSVILALTLPNEAFDINLSPDKQTVLLTHEKDLLGLIEEFVKNLWSGSSSGVFAVSQLTSTASQDNNSATAPGNNPEEDDENEEDDEDGERQMHKRRFAFVHDLSQAKMQHDLAGRQINDEKKQEEHANTTSVTDDNVSGGENADNQVTEECSPAKSDNPTEEEPREPPQKKARTPTTKQNLSVESPLSLNETTQAEGDGNSLAQTTTSSEPSKLSVSDKKRSHNEVSGSERLQWIAIQAKFQRRASGNDEVEEEMAVLSKTVSNNSDESKTAPVSPDELDPSPPTNLIHSERDVTQLSSSKEAPRKTTDNTRCTRSMIATTGNHGISGTSSKNSLLNSLKQFAFQPATRDTSSCDTDTKSIVQKNGRLECNGTSARKPMGRHEQDSTSQPSSPSSPRSIRQSVPDSSISLNGKDRNKVANGDEDCTEAPSTGPTLQSSTSEDVSEDAKKTGDRHHEPSNRQSKIADDTGSPKIETNKNEETVVWHAFQSTEQVCYTARMERIQMIKRKRDIDAVRRSIVAGSRDPNDNMAKTVQIDEDPTHEIDKKVCFDGEDTGDDDAPSDAAFIRISKSSFRDGMQVIGQFNLGFILAKCSRNHLWILDQHACDEKYNFEQLCKKTKIHEQPLIKPLPLELSPSEEACVLDHMDIFQANGFRFAFDPKAPIRHRLSLTALPHSGAHEGRKAVQFGPSDVSALCSILTEGSSYDPGDGGTGTDGSGMYGNNAVRRFASSMTRQQSSSTSSDHKNGDTADRILARLPKAIAMFASRACRTSVMIGTALSQREMEALVEKLSQVDSPWTCAHGRPTMRHVANLLPHLWKDERQAAEYIATPTITIAPLTQPDEED
eukprot:CAMPEP_0178885948 /NCGR_PEP_ID=MMETSP0747-20121128/15676_1 /TAXON_ID=913974 /ORGANISM="Nitzschia punctata, Strain CCMP561" /LENGTH=1246 /DNA_ID=CAMNT_0020554757 /DNA_START=331 /DNA_END=4071 /DNA_ORIENTATION=-